MSLPDKVRNSCRNISITDLNKDCGLDTLINNLERLYLKDKKAPAYLAYEKFESFQRPTEMNVIGYINEFERLYHEIQRYEMTLPTAILAYRVLKSANISNEKQQLARATITELNYENMKKQLKATHDSPSVSTENSFEIKSEPTYVTDMKDEPVYYGNNSTRGCFNNYKRGNSNSKQWKYNNPGTQHKSINTGKYGRRTNPVNSNGNITKCSICQ